MSVKQDRVAARTVTDLERKYSFGKTFAEMQGMIDDSRDRVSEIEDKVDSLDGTSSTSLTRNDVEIMLKAERQQTDYDIGKVNDRVDEVKATAELKVTADQVQATITKELSNGVTIDKDHAFTADGLIISQSGSPVENRVDHTGVYVTRHDENVLTADLNGVTATDLHAKTYLKVGSGEGRSRFEDYGIDRIGCFWIGG